MTHRVRGGSGPAGGCWLWNSKLSHNAHWPTAAHATWYGFDNVMHARLGASCVRTGHAPCPCQLSKRHTCARAFSTAAGLVARAPAVRPCVEPLRSNLRCSSASVWNTLPITTRRTCRAAHQLLAEQNHRCPSFQPWHSSEYCRCAFARRKWPSHKETAPLCINMVPVTTSRSCGALPSLRLGVLCEHMLSSWQSHL